MDVLISWSGRQSRSVADALYVWLPKVIPSLRPWMSTQDIDKGNRWLNELQEYLLTAKACIVCLTPENVTSPWLYWETGAVALTQSNPIYPLLINLSPDDVRDGPLGQFQCTYDRKDDVLHLVRSLNQRLDNPEDELRLQGLFATHWDGLHKALDVVAEMGIPDNILSLLRGLAETKETFRRRWQADKKADSWDPIRQLVNDTYARIERLVATLGVEERIKLHCDELKSAVNGITYGNRQSCHEQGDEIFAQFDKTVNAIRADYDPPSV